MHQYKIEVFTCDDNGGIGDLVSTRYADNPERARLICAEYDSQVKDGGGKAFCIKMYILCYKHCEDWASFLGQFQE